MTQLKELELISRAADGRRALALSDPRESERPGRRWRSLAGLWKSGLDVRTFTRQVATLLRAGFTLDRAFSILGPLNDGRRLGNVIREVREEVRGGRALAAALAAHPRSFGEFYRGMVAAGERSGELAAAFERLALHLERGAELRSRLLGALLYPAIMVVAGSAAVVLLLLVVIPRFAVILGDVGGELPWTAVALIRIGELVESIWWLPAIGLPLAFAAVAVHRRSPAGRIAQDRLLLRLPIVGPLRARLATERVARSLAGALAGGITLLTALEIASEAAGDAAIAEALEEARELVRRGESLSAALGKRRLVPELALQMIAAGEESGRLAPLLEHVAEAYRTETEGHLRSLVAVVEPAIIVVFGALVAFVALALLQTIYGIGSTL